jgi:hypothetical protein
MHPGADQTLGDPFVPIAPSIHLHLQEMGDIAGRAELHSPGCLECHGGRPLGHTAPGSFPPTRWCCCRTWEQSWVQNPHSDPSVL